SSFLRSELTGWTVNLALPRDTVDGPMRRNALLFGAVVAAAFLLSLVCARLVSRRFLQALTRLEYHVVQLAPGHVMRPPPRPGAQGNRMGEGPKPVRRGVAAAEAAAERERSLLKATVDSMPIGVLLVSPDGDVSLVNRKLLSLWDVNELHSLHDFAGISRFRRDGTPYPVSDWPVMRALRQGEVTDSEEVFHDVHGKRRCLMINAVPVRDSLGRIIAALATAYDVTEMRDAMKRQQILLDEINHRVRNTLATVQSVARLTLSSADTLDDYAAAFERRLLALSAAYNVLTDNNWQGADMRTIVERTLAPFSEAAPITVSGPSIRLTPRFTLALAAAVQELSTNAAKYGGLSTESGMVDVSWSVEDDGRIRFGWVE